MGDGGFAAGGVGMTSCGCEADGGFGYESGGGRGGGDDGGGGGDGVGDKRVTGMFGGLCSEEIPASDGDVGRSFCISGATSSVTDLLCPIMSPSSLDLINVVVSWA